MLNISHMLKTFAFWERKGDISLLNTLAITSWAKIVVLYKRILFENTQTVVIIDIIESISIVLLTLFYIIELIFQFLKGFSHILN